MSESAWRLFLLLTPLMLGGVLLGVLLGPAYKVRKVVVDDPAELRRIASEIARLSRTLNELVDERTTPKEPADAA